MKPLVAFPQISVIIPVYNGEKYIRPCLDSLIEQSFGDFEIILIDDGSTDNSLQICEEYANKDERINVFSKANAGANSARINGIEFSAGVFICFVDCDDTLNPNALEVFFKEIEGCDLLLSNCFIDDVIGAERYLSLMLDHKLPKELWGKLYRRRILDDWVMCLPKEIVVGEDFIWNVRVAKNVKNVRLLTNNYYSYRMLVADSLMTKFKPTPSGEELFYRELSRSLEQMGMNDSKIKALLSLQRYNTLVGLIRHFEISQLDNIFVREIASPSSQLRGKVSIVIFAFMYLPFLKWKILFLRLYFKLRRK